MLSNVEVVRSSPSETSTFSSPASSCCTTPDDDASGLQLTRQKAVRPQHTDAFAIRLAERRAVHPTHSLAVPRRVPVPRAENAARADHVLRQGQPGPSAPAAPGSAVPRTLLPAALRDPQRTLGKYRPLGDAQQAQLGLAHRYAVLLGIEGTYAFARAHVQGSYGKVHFGLPLRDPHGPTAQGLPKLAIKAQRLAAKAGRARLTQGPKTFEASLRQVLYEFRVHQSLRQNVNERAPALHADWLPQGEATLRAFVPRELPSHIYDLVVDSDHRTKAGRSAPKAYIVSTCELGDAHALYRHMWSGGDGQKQRRLRRQVARSYAYQTFVELHVLHAACHHAHLDIKASNVHVNEAGGFRLADLGFALPVDAGGLVDVRGPRGTIASYEMYPPACFGGAVRAWPRLHAHTDVMTNWVTALQFLAPPSIAPPFVRRASFDKDGEEHVDDASCIAELRDFLRVLEKVRTVDGKARLPRLASGEGVWPASENRVVDRFFRAVAAADVELLELALSYGMGFSPTGRAGADQQARRVGALLGATGESDAAELRDYVAAYAAPAASERRFAELESYAQCVAQAPRLGAGVASAKPAPVAPPGPCQAKLRRGPAVVGALAPKLRQAPPPAGAAFPLA